MNADGAPLQLHDKDAVDVGYVRDLYELLRAIDEVIPKDAILYVEGANIAPLVAEFLAARETSEKAAVEPNTTWPKPSVFHLPLSGTNLEEFPGLADQHAEPEIADHLVVYRGRDVLLWAHDAGSGHVELSRALPRETLRRSRIPWPTSSYRRARERQLDLPRAHITTEIRASLPVLGGRRPRASRG